MEVHHHAHTARKKWTHYFWEFLMLFLAVFCGFLAEYQLEHKIEKDRGKKYIISMYEDLKMDTAVLTTLIQNRNRRSEMFDSLLLLIDNPGEHLDDVYFFGRHITRTGPVLFFNNDRTIEQLKHAGGLRLITNRKVSDSIIIYDKQVRLVLERQENELANIRECYAVYYKIFDGRVFYKMLDKNNNILRPPSNISLLKFSSDDLNSFIGYAQMIYSANISNYNFLKTLKESATALLNLIKKEYHLK